MYKYLLIILSTLAFGCTNPESKNETVRETTFTEKDSIIPNAIRDSIRAANHLIIENILVKNKIEVDFKHYDLDECFPTSYDTVNTTFEAANNLGKILNDDNEVYTIVLNPLNFCEEGQSYYFTADLPRLSTDSECCHPNSLFSVGDLDEDGIDEIGQYYSSCTSRYKSLKVYSLKNNAWNEIGKCTYDLAYSDFGIGEFSNYVRKLGKGVFEMLEITDIGDPKYEGKPNWIRFQM
ncbi:hypothetical protein K6119_04360 [Paracrocinitomix mangrovi]|uniref:hypothetical protein n=1 Tax=Paracrocinitomix mangrovi TaxID=2862509 RepID=UPI001C8DA483|nr:hypothetical protein [Paracrocinitomix mangrovi]UKN02747.1 hypothetical protein K6119_04360 [Paracrocinitomix mangrovi]